ncbi:MAG: hypothetical protein A2075_00165 [Geobacteraceae bacterium GWC2_58_44]|nr:MAG: hypothetical protein A2075_00165 [Geobacteraceae bacterium GWC2_58_44]HBG06526.1 hypothetical protein [Geobacter sp.]
MSQLPVTIPKRPALKPAEDYYLLRRKGIGFIEEMGSRLWTDYNSHDPGITILEALCYAITDLAYRAGWDIKDILAPETDSSDPSQPFPNQAFFTAREILTVNPTTPDDFRRLLIDLETVRNAWVFCKECACDLSYYAWCENDKLLLSYRAPALTPAPQPVSPRGLYEILVELETDPDLGDLNDSKIVFRSTFHDADGAHATTMELRFPEIGMSDREGWALFLDSDDAFADLDGLSLNLKLTRFGATKTYDVFSDPDLDEEGRDGYLRSHWRGTFYLSFEIELVAEAKTIVFENAALRLFSDNVAKNAATAEGLKAVLEEKSADGFIQRYRKKAQQQSAAVERAKEALLAHRNLDEDYCRIDIVGIEEVAVCADVEVKPDADIERVQARIWFEIEQYFNAPVPFYSLQELMDAAVAVEEIFNGPELESGFIKAEDLEAAALKSVLRVSDIINRLMDIDGVIAVNGLQLAKYDAAGNVVRGAADPTWSSEGNPVFDSSKASASWLMYISKQHQPRLYLNASRFLFYLNGLPFLPRMDEASDTLNQLRGEAERPKIKNAPKDLPIPAGTFLNPEDYFPVQYSFPLTYGIGAQGLPSHASSLRRAQARQLKAYLLIFEQLLGNAFAQIAHAADLFSLDPAVERTYFVREFSKAIINGYDEIVSGLNHSALEKMTETLPEFHERRNRFLDHILARFGEQFREYALLLTNLQGQQVALDQLIDDKIAFLKAYPLISHDRGRAFNYAVDPCSPDNYPGIKKRITLLLGLDNERAIVVEHLLLRPKFPGDALYPACSVGACRICGEEDPYSFRVTFVMPGWLEPFNTDMEMRGFADRTIREETPSHLLGKICWVGNDGFTEDPDNPVVIDLADLLVEKGLTAGGTKPERADACDCGAAIYTAFNNVFKEWFQDKTLAYIRPDLLKTEMEAEFNAKVNPGDFSCTTVLDAVLWAEVQAMMVAHFHHVALYGWQFERFEDAWCKWLEADALIDWTEEHLQARVEAILAKNLISPDTASQNVPSPGGGGLGRGDGVCRCAAAIVTDIGMEFYELIGAAFKAGTALEDIPDFAPSEVVLCPDFEFNSGTAGQIQELLEERYNAYKEVSYRLWMVVDLLSKLSNSYPPATLHDFDAGSDHNPVRLGKTALGS